VSGWVALATSFAGGRTTVAVAVPLSLFAASGALYAMGVTWVVWATPCAAGGAMVPGLVRWYYRATSG
jgi:hypothetical protein